MRAVRLFSFVAAIVLVCIGIHSWDTDRTESIAEFLTAAGVLWIAIE